MKSLTRPTRSVCSSRPTQWQKSISPLTLSLAQQTRCNRFRCWKIFTPSDQDASLAVHLGSEQTQFVGNLQQLLRAKHIADRRWRRRARLQETEMEGSSVCTILAFRYRNVTLVFKHRNVTLVLRRSSHGEANRASLLQNAMLVYSQRLCQNATFAFYF